MANCKYCGREGSHYCHSAQRQIDENNSDDFIASALLGAALHEVSGGGIIGGLIGGDIVGGIVGDAIADSIFGDD